MYSQVLDTGRGKWTLRMCIVDSSGSKKNQKTPLQRKERKLHGKNNNMKIDIIILQPPHYFKQIKGNFI